MHCFCREMQVLAPLLDSRRAKHKPWPFPLPHPLAPTEEHRGKQKGKRVFAAHLSPMLEEQSRQWTALERPSASMTAPEPHAHSRRASLSSLQVESDSPRLLSDADALADGCAGTSVILRRNDRRSSAQAARSKNGAGGRVVGRGWRSEQTAISCSDFPFFAVVRRESLAPATNSRVGRRRRRTWRALLYCVILCTNVCRSGKASGARG